MSKFIKNNTSGKKLVLLKACFILATIVFTGLKASSEEYEVIETKNIEVTPKKQTRLPLKDVEKVIIANPSIASFEIDNNGITFTGVGSGSTSVFIRLKGQEGLLSYVLNSSYFTSDNKLKSETEKVDKIIYTDKKQATSGNYTLFSSSSFGSDINTNYQNVNHTLSYNMPFFGDGRLLFNTSFANVFSNFNSLENLTLSNIDLDYSAKDLNVKIGNVNSRNIYSFNSNSGDTMNQFRNNLRGVKLSAKSDALSYSFYSGLPVNNFVLYNKPTQKGSTYVPSNNRDSFTSGVSGEVLLPFKNLSVFATANSNISFNLENDKLFNFISGFNIEPLDNLKFNAIAGTNFSDFAFFLNSSYLYTFNGDRSKRDQLKISGSLRNIGNNYFRVGVGSQNSYILSTSFKHNSGLTLSGAYSLNSVNETSRNSLSFSASKNLFSDLLNVYGSTNLNSYNNDQKYESYQVGFLSKYLIPLNLNYGFLRSSVLDTNNIQHQLRALIDIFKNENIDIKTGVNYNKNFSTHGENTQISANLSSIVKISKNLSLSGNVMYGSNFANSKQNNSDTLILGSRINWLINSANQLNLDLFYNNNLSQIKTYNLSTGLSYTYNFGSAYEEAKGSIKGFVFEDKNDNYIFDSDETPIPGVKLALRENKSISSINGYEFKDLPYDTYELTVDSSTIPKGYRLTGSSSLPIKLSSDYEQANFALSQSGIIKGIIFNNKIRTKTSQHIEIILDNKESFTTSDNGLFSFNAPMGKHTVRINPTTIPVGYRLLDKLSKEVDLDREAEVVFTLNPVITFTGKFLNKAGKPAINVPVTIKYDNAEGYKEEVFTDEDGEVFLPDLIEGTLEISSPLMKEPLLLNIISEPQEIKETIILTE